jgi:hypothetical protein
VQHKRSPPRANWRSEVAASPPGICAGSCCDTRACDSIVTRSRFMIVRCCGVCCCVCARVYEPSVVLLDFGVRKKKKRVCFRFLNLTHPPFSTKTFEGMHTSLCASHALVHDTRGLHVHTPLLLDLCRYSTSQPAHCCLVPRGRVARQASARWS